jgi:hypothetical protein
LKSKPHTDDDLSKSTADFLVHLRLVHFSLLVTCLALLVAATSAPPYIMENAYRQAQEIAARVGDPRYWLLDELSLNRQIREIYQKAPLAFSDGVSTFRVDDSFLTYVGYSSLMADNVPQLSAVEEIGSAYGEPGISFGTLKDFVEFWNRLAKLRNVPFVQGWERDAALLELDPSHKVDMRVVERKEGKDIHVLEAKFDGAGPRRQLVISVSPEYRGQIQPIRTIRVPVTVGRIDYQAEFISSIGVQWPPGRFSESFADLSRFSKGLESLNYTDLRDHLQKLVSEVGPPMQVLGVSIPVRSFRVMGPLVLLAVQLYLYLHIRRLRTVSLDPTVIERFAWIGVYEGWLSRLPFTLSITALPVLAAYIIANHGGLDMVILPAAGTLLANLLTGCTVLIAIGTFFEMFPGARQTSGAFVNKLKNLAMQLTNKCSRRSKLRG